MRLRTDKMGEGFDRLERRLTAIRDLHLWAGIHDLSAPSHGIPMGWVCVTGNSIGGIWQAMPNN